MHTQGTGTGPGTLTHSHTGTLEGLLILSGLGLLYWVYPAV